MNVSQLVVDGHVARERLVAHLREAARAGGHQHAGPVEHEVGLEALALHARRGEQVDQADRALVGHGVHERVRALAGLRLDVRERPSPTCRRARSPPRDAGSRLTSPLLPLWVDERSAHRIRKWTDAADECPAKASANPATAVYDRKREPSTIGNDERHAHRRRRRRQRDRQGRPGRDLGRAARERAGDRRGRARAARAGPRGRAHARQRPAGRRAAAPAGARRGRGRAAAARRADRGDPGRDRLPARERVRRARPDGAGRRAAHPRARRRRRRRLRQPDQAGRPVLRRGRGAAAAPRRSAGTSRRTPAAAGAASCPARTRSRCSAQRARGGAARARHGGHLLRRRRDPGRPAAATRSSASRA